MELVVETIQVPSIIFSKIGPIFWQSCQFQFFFFILKIKLELTQSKSIYLIVLTVLTIHITYDLFSVPCFIMPSLIHLHVYCTTVVSIW